MVQTSFLATLLLFSITSGIFFMHVTAETTADEIREQPLDSTYIQGLREEEIREQPLDSTYIQGLREEITVALNTSDWGPVKQLLQRRLIVTSLEYAQLQDSKPEKYLPWIAAERGYTELINVLISNGLFTDQKLDNAEYTMLHLASANGHECLASFLLDNGANIEETDKFGWTAVHHAAVAGRIDLLKLLFKRGADINKKNTSIGFTPLHYASFYGRLSMVYYLITSTNCDPSIQAYNGKTAADVAEYDGYDSILEILSKKYCPIFQRLKN